VAASPTTYTIQTPVSILDNEAKVCKLIDPDTNWWNIPLIKELFREEEVEMICGMAICPRTQQDRVVWVGNKSGLFIVRSAYHIAKELENREVGSYSSGDKLTILWNKIWKIQVPRVVSLFLWQAYNNVLPTKENLFKRKITDDPLCPVCLMEVETIGHALWSCTTACNVWMEMSAKTHKSISKEDDFSHILLCLLDRLEESEFGKVACTTRQIWLKSNKLVFEGLFTHPKIVAKTAAYQMEFYLKVSIQGANGNRHQISHE
jgi:hypothetical protein